MNNKVHTHYDNLKVARGAPPEVIRAAYKALSQKYHPDKNPGDIKAARIMAILNSAYGTLADPQRRKEHDEWITAEEWEIDWLESTHQDEAKDRHLNDQADAQWAREDVKLMSYRPSRDPKWWVILIACVGIGWSGAVLMQKEPDFIAMVLSHTTKADQTAKAKLAPESDATAHYQPLALSAAPSQPESKIVAVSQIQVPSFKTACDAAAPPRAPTAPNGESWPAKTGYIDGYRVQNMGGYTQIIVDNSNNGVDIYVRLFDIEKNHAVRHVLVFAHEKFTMEQLNAGNYEVRYDALGVSDLQKAQCMAFQAHGQKTDAVADESLN
jgi:hypothetical protein